MKQQQQQPKFTVKRLLDADKNGKIVRIAPICGTIQAGGIFCFSVLGGKVFIVVGQDAYYKFGNAQIAAVSGVAGQDYHTFYTAKDAVKFANSLLNELIKAQKAHKKSLTSH